MTQERVRVVALVPQSGAMCLLDAVSQWDASSIACSAAAPGANHPLLRDGALPAVAGCEYAAQATAVHGALLGGGGTPKAGMLAKLMDVELRRTRFTQDAGPVHVRATVVSRSDAACMYSFDVTQGDMPVVSGRLLVAFSR